jgi:hypothetical protein
MVPYRIDDFMHHSLIICRTRPRCKNVSRRTVSLLSTLLQFMHSTRYAGIFWSKASVQTLPMELGGVPCMLLAMWLWWMHFYFPHPPLARR